MDRTRVWLFLAVVALVCACGTAWAEGDLVAHWTFDGYVTGNPLTEQTGNISPGTVTGSMVTTGSPPATVAYDFGDAIYFDGVDDEVTIPEAPELRISTGSFSISFMWKQASGPSSGAGRDGTLLIKGFISDYDGGEYYRVKQQEEKITLSCDDGMSDAAPDWAKKEIKSVAGTLMDDQWHHVVVVRDTSISTLIIYRDGEVNTTLVYQYVEDQTGNLDAPGQPLRFGVARNADSSVSEAYVGPANVDDLRIYDGALSQEEIEYIYLGGTPTPTPLEAGVQPWQIFD